MLSNQSMKYKEMPEILSLQEASSILKCHPNTLRQWDKKGILKAIRFGERGDRKYKKEDILKLLSKHTLTFRCH